MNLQILVVVLDGLLLGREWSELGLCGGRMTLGNNLCLLPQSGKAERQEAELPVHHGTALILSEGISVDAMCVFLVCMFVASVEKY
jgi:hypothetical protein